MNALVVGTPGPSARVLARMLTAAGGPVTLLSSDTAGLLAALAEPGLTGVDVIWADPAEPSSCDDAVAHRRMLHPTPEQVVVVVDDPDDGSWELGSAVVRRLPEVPWRVTGTAAPTLATAAHELASALAAEPSTPAPPSAAGCCHH